MYRAIAVSPPTSTIAKMKSSGLLSPVRISFLVIVTVLAPSPRLKVMYHVARGSILTLKPRSSSSGSKQKEAKGVTCPSAFRY